MEEDAKDPASDWRCRARVGKDCLWGGTAGLDPQLRCRPWVSRIREGMRGSTSKAPGGKCG